MTRAIDTATVSENRLVRYGVYHPTKGWMGKYICKGYASWHNQPKKLWGSSQYPTRYAKEFGAQLVMFDVIPCLRSWPGEEPETPCEPKAKETK